MNCQITIQIPLEFTKKDIQAAIKEKVASIGTKVNPSEVILKNTELINVH